MADKHGAKPERRAEPYAKFQDSQRGGASLHIRRQSRCKGLLGQSRPPRLCGQAQNQINHRVAEDRQGTQRGSKTLPTGSTATSPHRQTSAGRNPTHGTRSPGFRSSSSTVHLRTGLINEKSKSGKGLFSQMRKRPYCGVRALFFSIVEETYFFAGNSDTFTYDDVLKYVFAASLIAAASSFL